MLTDLFCFISSFKNSAEPVGNKLIFCGFALYGDVHHLFRYTDKERILLEDNLNLLDQLDLLSRSVAYLLIQARFLVEGLVFSMLVTSIIQGV